MSYVLVETIVRDSEGAEIDKRPIAFVEVIPGIITGGEGSGTTLNGTGFVKATGTTISYDNSTYVPTNNPITGAVKTKITFDSKGLVTAGADATTADIAASTDKNYVTNAQATVIGNTSGTNTGDETTATIKTKLGISNISGSNTGDQDLSTLAVKANNLSDLSSATTARTNLGLGTLATQNGTFSGTASGTNTGDETITTIKSKLGITTLSGSNTGDQDLSALAVKANNLSDLANAGTARSNLGLGTLATQSGTFSGTSSGTNSGDETTTRINTLYGYTPASAATVATNTAAIAAKDTKSMEIKAYQAFGSTLIAESVAAKLGALNTTLSLTSGTAIFTAVYLNDPQTITGAKFIQRTQGVYTANNYNGIGLYSYSSGTLTLVASSTDDGNIWKGTSGSLQTKAFTTAYSAAAGIYVVEYLYSTSAQTTAPILAASISEGAAVISSGDFTNSAKLTGVSSSQTTLLSSLLMSSLAANAANVWVGIY